MYLDDTSPLAEFKYPDWQPWYRSALLEFDRKKLPNRVNTAESAIYSRLASIAGDSNRHDERDAIHDALQGLSYLKRELPDDTWNSR